jgi:glyoxylase-like metal-dependent hydrolase (beta-lactamase superfamily II)
MHSLIAVVLSFVLFCVPVLAEEDPVAPPLPPVEEVKPLFDEEDLSIQRFETTCNSYLLTCKATKDFVAIDPGPGMVERIRAWIATGHNFTAIWLTHEHPDHIAGLGEMRKAFDVPMLTHEASKGDIAACIQNWTTWQLDRMSPVPPVMPDTFIADGATVKVGELELSVLHVPGHSRGSLGYLLKDRFLFIGDVLFKNSVGRTDLPTSDAPLFKKSLSEKLWDLPGEIVAFPGHGEHTTIADEKRDNWLFQDHVREARGEKPVPRPWMGVQIAGVRDGGGLLLEQVVEGSPANAAGLAAGDVILELGGEAIRELPDLWRVIRLHEAGDTVKLKFLRGEETKEVDFTFGARPR